MITCCNVEGCSNPQHSLGFCRAHYDRFKRHGDPCAGGAFRRRNSNAPTMCTVPGCDMPHASHGYCGKHAYRWRVHDDPLGGGTSKGEAAEWLRRHVNYDGDDCLIWPFARDKSGYGNVKFGSASGAHRAMCILAHGEPPDGRQDAAHSCGKGHLGCVNPRHLSWKTRAENLWGRVEHGTIVRGEEQRNALLTENDVRQIRELKGKVLQKDIAASFGVSPSLISRIHSRQIWAYLDADAENVGGAHV